MHFVTHPRSHNTSSTQPIERPTTTQLSTSRSHIRLASRNGMASDKNLLLDVPPELADHIASFLPKEDLLELRTVSKDTAARCDRAVTSVIPTQLDIIFCWRTSLETALLIAKNDTWRRKIKTVSVLQDQPHKGALDTGEYMHPFTWWTMGSARKIRSTVRDRRRAYRAFLDDHSIIVKSDQDEKILAQVLRYLGKCGAGAAIEVLDIHDIAQGELDKLYAEIEDCPLYTEWDNHRPLQSVLRAVQHSGFKPASFRVYTSDSDTFAVPFNIFSGSACFGPSSHAFSRLAVLKLVMEELPHPEHANTESQDIESFIAFLHSISAYLKVFDCSLSCGGPHPAEPQAINTLDKAFSRMVDEITFVAIEDLALGGIHTDYQRFITFVGRHARTVKYLYTENIWAHNCGPALARGQWDRKVEADLQDVGIGLMDHAVVDNMDEL